METDQQFVEFVLKSVVDHPDEVSVERTIDEMGVLISVTVNPEDMGKVIGKSGQTAKAIRTLLKVVGAKNDARVNMKIIEPEGGRPPAAAPATAAAAPIATGTDAVDDSAVEAVSPVDDPDAVNTAEQIQHQTDAAVTTDEDDNNSMVDEATGETADPAEPESVQDEQPDNQARRDPIHERSPLDDL